MSESQKLADVLGTKLNKEDAIQIIKSDPAAYEQFLDFPPDFQNQVLQFIQGMRGLPILYDSFFKSVFNPITTPERLEHFLSCLMGQKIQIMNVIPREGSQLTDKSSFVIMDILVQTETGSYVNVEMQKHGYEFAGERSTCYMSDLVMRQYAQVRSEKKARFSFKDLKPVYLIVLMENSTKNFKSVSPEYIHRIHYTCDSGADVNFLANYTYISLDTFRSVVHNIDSYLDAWFTFLSSDSPESILKLINAYPEFKEYYHDIALFRKKPKELMNMYSEALIQMDRNTVNYMIEEMQKEVNELTSEVKEARLALHSTQSMLAEADATLAEKISALAEKDSALAEKDSALAEKDSALAEKDAYIKELEKKLGINNS